MPLTVKNDKIILSALQGMKSSIRILLELQVKADDITAFYQDCLKAAQAQFGKDHEEEIGSMIAEAIIKHKP